MGIVQRQGIKYAFVSILGTIIGAISIIFIYPRDLENYGLLQTILAYNLLISPIIGLGFNNSIINFSGTFKINNSDLIIVCSLLNLFFGTIVFFLLISTSNYLFPSWVHQNPIVFNQKYNLYFISISTVLIGGFVNFSNTLGRSVIPNLLFNVGLKIWIPTILVLILYKITPNSNIFLLLDLFYGIVLILLIVYTLRLSGVPQKGFLKRISLINFDILLKYSFFNGIAGILTILALKLDIIYISELETYKDVAKYSLPFFMANLLELPLGGITNILTPILAQNIKLKNLTNASLLLQKASNILLISSGFIFCMIFSLFDLLAIISGKGEAFQNGLILFSVIGIAKMIDIGTGLNSHVITYSNYFKLNLIISPIMAVINIFITYLLTKKFGIIGTAFSVLIVIIVYNIFKSFILFKYLKINAFNLNSLNISLFITFCILILNFVKSFHLYIFLEIAINILLVLILNFVFIYLKKPSEELYSIIFNKGSFKNIFNSVKLF